MWQFISGCILSLGVLLGFGGIQKLSSEQLEILDHMSIVYIDDGSNNLLKTIRISNINVQIVNGEGSTNSKNGFGNLIVGYNEPNTPFPSIRTGSHNIIVGTRNNYWRWGGLVAGRDNSLYGEYSSIPGGMNNTTNQNALGGTVSGGTFNESRAAGATVSGGTNRSANGNDDWVAGSLFEDY